MARIELQRIQEISRCCGPWCLEGWRPIGGGARWSLELFWQRYLRWCFIWEPSIYSTVFRSSPCCSTKHEPRVSTLIWVQRAWGTNRHGSQPKVVHPYGRYDFWIVIQARPIAQFPLRSLITSRRVLMS